MQTELFPVKIHSIVFNRENFRMEQFHSQLELLGFEIVTDTQG